MAGQNPGSPTDFQYFYEDEVYKINNRGEVVFGLVLENYEGNSSDPDSDVETPIQKGEIRVVWHPSGIERVVSEKSVGLADRSLMPGDVVRRLIAGKDTQRGYCRDIVMTAALQIVGTKHVIPAVASERLQPLEEFTNDLAVCLDSWVGTSKAVRSKMRLVAPDGSRLQFNDLDSCPLEDYSLRRRRETRYSSPEFYPGQVVYGPVSALENAKWLELNKDMKNCLKQKNHEAKLTVEAVVTESVSVHWQCRALCTQPNDAVPQQPKFLVEGDELKNLKLLNVFEPCTLQVGDRNYLTIGPDDTFVNKKAWRKTQSQYFRNHRKLHRQPYKKVPSKLVSNPDMPSKPKKRAANRKMNYDCNNEMEVDGLDEKIDLDDTLKENCPSIKIEPSTDQFLPNTSSQEDTTTEEKNDSGISPEPNKEDLLMNGDSKSSDIQVNDDDSENWENTSSDGSDTDSGATWSSRCSSVTSQRGKRSPQLVVRLLRGKRLKRTARRAPPAPPPKVGDRVIVETLHTTSHANVVWQDGTIVMSIPSSELYPIHHLDGQECFPGDFVVGSTASLEENVQKHREYGVVQRVDHHGRTAIVNWYRTYTSCDEPIPQLLSESEVSVYDLKDHPDFQYRPGTVVIRVANFTGEDANCTAGQVIDNYPSGRVKVWWVDGHTSMCWPQDLYKVGEYDSDDGELWGSEGTASEDSWETQSSAEPPPQPPPTLIKEIKLLVPSNPGPLLVPKILEPRVAIHIERGRAAMKMLEQMFAKNPALQSQEVIDRIMRKLLNLYKECRFLDRLMGTTYFHEDHFLGLLERVRERGINNPCAAERRVHEQLTRLFTPTEEESAPDFGKAKQDDALMTSEESTLDEAGKDTYSFNPRAIIASNVTAEPMEVDENTETVGETAHSAVENFCGSAPDELESEIKALVIPGTTQIRPDASRIQDIQGRNVCFKLCGLIHSQLIKAHTDLSRRRPNEMAKFLNAFRKLTQDEKFPYHFTVQYGQLVVTIEDSEPMDLSKPVVKATETVAEKTEAPPVEVVVPPAEAPLATADPAELDADPSPSVTTVGGEGFALLDEAPHHHRFRSSTQHPVEPKTFYSAVNREIKLLKSDLPPGAVQESCETLKNNIKTSPDWPSLGLVLGNTNSRNSDGSVVRTLTNLTKVWVKAYEDRIDLLSVMIAGPVNTPYEGGLFLFDVQLGADYPRAPPLCLYHSYCSDRLNPNLYEDGKVCVSLLGTWSGRGVEVWGKESSVLQVIVSLQGLILNNEPYFNEAGYEKQKGTQQGKENSRMYNEMVLLKLVQSMTKMILNPPAPFRNEILQYLHESSAPLCRRLEAWVAISNGETTDIPPPDFPLVPASRGFCLTLRSSLDAFRTAISRSNSKMADNL